jgi:uncharacterized membrane protein
MMSAMRVRWMPAWRRWIAGPGFGNTVIVMFLLCQMLDGALTYVGVQTFGRQIEANPLLAWLMNEVGDGTAVTSAKVVAGSCGIALHLTAVHRIVAVLTLVYVGFAVIPWTGLLFF